MTIFYIADFEIDLSRSLICKGEEQTQVEPKVLKVLLLLAQHQGEVVSHQQIMGEVWSGTEVVPNALQRCIAILRKVLDDDAKSPAIIATQPKIGYRLIAEVEWQSPVELLPENTPTQKVMPLPSTAKAIPLVTLMLGVLLLLTMITAFWPGKLPGQYTQIQQLTRTDAHETQAIFNPDGSYLVFSRYAGGCKNHLWARHTISGKETQLTSSPGYYGTASFTYDGRELVFAAKESCGEMAQQQLSHHQELMCWSIASLDFSLALNAPQQPSLRYQCQAEKIEKVKALSNHKYAFLQYQEGYYQLMQYDDLTKSLSTLYSSEQDYIYHFDHDPKHKRFAVISRDKALNNVLLLLNEKGQQQRREIIRLDADMSQNQQFIANFEPDASYLLAISNQQLYQLQYDGQLLPVATPEANLVSVSKHPYKPQLLAVTGHKDIDVAQLPLGASPSVITATELNSQATPFASFVRSNAQERKAQYQPNGNNIAFISDRNGQDQIWLWQQGQISALSSKTGQQSIHHFSWSPDGKQLAWVANDQLSINSLDGETRVLATNKPLYSVLSWYQANKLLVLLNGPTPGALYQFDLVTKRLTALDINQVENAWIYQNQLFYSKFNGDVFTRTVSTESSKSQFLPHLNGKALVIHEASIYSVDKHSFELTQYDLLGQRIKTIMPLKTNAWKITDFRNQQLLLSQFIAIDQEIVLMQ